MVGAWLRRRASASPLDRRRATRLTSMPRTVAISYSNALLKASPLMRLSMDIQKRARSRMAPAASGSGGGDDGGGAGGGEGGDGGALATKSSSQLKNCPETTPHEPSSRTSQKP